MDGGAARILRRRIIVARGNAGTGRSARAGQSPDTGHVPLTGHVSATGHVSLTGHGTRSACNYRICPGTLTSRFRVITPEKTARHIWNGNRAIRACTTFRASTSLRARATRCKRYAISPRTTTGRNHSGGGVEQRYRAWCLAAKAA